VLKSTRAIGPGRVFASGASNIASSSRARTGDTQLSYTGRRGGARTRLKGMIGRPRDETSGFWHTRFSQRGRERVLPHPFHSPHVFQRRQPRLRPHHHASYASVTQRQMHPLATLPLQIVYTYNQTRDAWFSFGVTTFSFSLPWKRGKNACHGKGGEEMGWALESIASSREGAI